MLEEHTVYVISSPKDYTVKHKGQVLHKTRYIPIVLTPDKPKSKGFQGLIETVNYTCMEATSPILFHWLLNKVKHFPKFPAKMHKGVIQGEIITVSHNPVPIYLIDPSNGTMASVTVPRRDPITDMFYRKQAITDTSKHFAFVDDIENWSKDGFIEFTRNSINEAGKIDIFPDHFLNNLIIQQ